MLSSFMNRIDLPTANGQKIAWSKRLSMANHWLSVFGTTVKMNQII